MGRHEGTAAVITGATSGIGEATVDAYCAEGAHVVLCGRNEELGRQVKARQPPVRRSSSRPTCCVRRTSSASSVPPWIARLFNNVGGSATPPGKPRVFNIDIDEESLNYSQRYLLGSCMNATRHALAHAQARSGAIVSKSSKGAH